MKIISNITRVVLSVGFVLLTVVAFGGLAAAQTCIQPPGGLVSWWPGDGNANDIRGGNNGTLQGGVSFSAAEVAQGFSFNSNADGVTISHNPNLNIQSSGFSADFWMRGIKDQPDSFQSTFVEKSHGFVDTTGWAFQVRSSTGFPLFAIGDGTGNAFPEVIGAVDVLDGNFHHIAGTWDGSILRLYVDGVLQSGVVTTAFNSTPANNNRDMNIGFTWAGGGQGRFFRGIIDELEIFNRELSLSEIQAIFLSGSAGKCNVEIDIKPASFPNSINPRNRGRIPVAILTTDTFNASTVDPTTVLFGRIGTEAAAMQSAVEDIDGDGDNDLNLHFNTQDTGTVCGDASAFLTGQTLGGQALRGSDSVNMVECK